MIGRDVRATCTKDRHPAPQPGQDPPRRGGMGPGRWGKNRRGAGVSRLLFNTPGGTHPHRVKGNPTHPLSGTRMSPVTHVWWPKKYLEPGAESYLWMKECGSISIFWGTFPWDENCESDIILKPSRSHPAPTSPPHPGGSSVLLQKLTQKKRPQRGILGARSRFPFLAHNTQGKFPSHNPVATRRKKTQSVQYP